MSGGAAESVFGKLGALDQIAQIELRSLIDAQAKIVELITSNAPLDKILSTIATELESSWTQSHVAVLTTSEFESRVRVTAPSLPNDLAQALSTADVSMLVSATSTNDPFQPTQWSGSSSDLAWTKWGDAAAPSSFDSAWTSLITPLDDPAPAWLVIVVADNTELDDGNVALVRRFAQLCRLAIDQNRREAQLQRLIADERRRLAGIVHDDPIQALTAVGLRIQRLSRHVEGDAIAQVHELHGAVSNAIDRMRRLLIDLHPPTLDDEGLVSAIDAYLGEVIEPLGIESVLVENGSGEPALGTASLAYRLVAEALWNVVKHANAKRVEVVVSLESGSVGITVQDDGDGFEISQERRRRAGHMGLSACRELATRASGSWHIDSELGHGTNVRIWLPGLEVGESDGGLSNS